MNFLETIRQLRGFKTTEVIRENTNKFRLLIKESDGLTAYYSSCPIYRGADGRLTELSFNPNGERHELFVNNGIIVVQDGELIFSGAEVYAKITTESDIAVSPSYNGVLVTVKDRKCRLHITTKKEYYIYENLRCYALTSGVYQPVLNILGLYGKSEEQVCPVKVSSISNSGNEYDAEIASEENVTEIVFEINLYVNKFVLDTTVEEDRPDVNNVYGGIAFLGRKGRDTEQRLYTRIDGTKLSDLSRCNVMRATLYLPKISGGNSSLTAYKLGLPWCTLGTTWNNKIDYVKELPKIRTLKKYESVNITEYIREVMKENTLRDAGTMLSGGSEQTVVTTGDSCAYPQIIELRLKR